MSVGQQRVEMERQTDFAYSIRLSVTAGSPSFLIMRIFRGGDGHCKESKSLFGVARPVNIIPKRAGKITLISRNNSILQTLHIKYISSTCRAAESSPPNNPSWHSPQDHHKQ